MHNFRNVAENNIGTGEGGGSGFSLRMGVHVYWTIPCSSTPLVLRILLYRDCFQTFQSCRLQHSLTSFRILELSALSFSLFSRFPPYMYFMVLGIQMYVRPNNEIHDNKYITQITTAYNVFICSKFMQIYKVELPPLLIAIKTVLIMQIKKKNNTEKCNEK